MGLLIFVPDLKDAYAGFSCCEWWNTPRMFVFLCIIESCCVVCYFLQQSFTWWCLNRHVEYVHLQCWVRRHFWRRKCDETSKKEWIKHNVERLTGAGFACMSIFNEQKQKSEHHCFFSKIVVLHMFMESPILLGMSVDCLRECILDVPCHCYD